MKYFWLIVKNSLAMNSTDTWRMRSIDSKIINQKWSKRIVKINGAKDARQFCQTPNLKLEHKVLEAESMHFAIIKHF